MKKFLLVISLFTLSQAVQAQGVYVRAYGGVAQATTLVRLGVDGKGTATVNDDVNLYGTLGGGTNFGINVGYMFSKHVGVDLGIYKFMGKTVTASKDNIAPIAGVPNAYTIATATAYSEQIRAVPTIVVSSGGEKIEVFARVGLLAPVSGKSVGVQTVRRGFIATNDFIPIDTLQVTQQIAGKFSLGFTGTVGASYHITPKISAFGEVQFVGLSVSRESGEVIEYKRSGVVRSIADFETELQRKAKTTYVDQNPDPSKGIELNTPSPFNSVGYNFGLKFSF